MLKLDSGLQITAEFNACHPINKNLLTDIKKLERELSSALRLSGLSPVSSSLNTFQEKEHVIVIIIQEGHVVLHVYPEKNATVLDIFVANLSADNSESATEITGLLETMFKPEFAVVRNIHRNIGDVPA